jgi:hypothetical protein
MRVAMRPVRLEFIVKTGIRSDVICFDVIRKFSNQNNHSKKNSLFFDLIPNNSTSSYAFPTGGYAVMRSKVSEPLSSSYLKARTRADYRYFLSYRTRW